MPAVSGIAYGYRAGSRWDLLYKTLHVSSVKLDCVTDNATNAVSLFGDSPLFSLEGASCCDIWVAKHCTNRLDRPLRPSNALGGHTLNPCPNLALGRQERFLTGHNSLLAGSSTETTSASASHGAGAAATPVLVGHCPLPPALQAQHRNGMQTAAQEEEHAVEAVLEAAPTVPENVPATSAAAGAPASADLEAAASTSADEAAAQIDLQHYMDLQERLAQLQGMQVWLDSGWGAHRGALCSSC